MSEKEMQDFLFKLFLVKYDKFFPLISPVDKIWVLLKYQLPIPSSFWLTSRQSPEFGPCILTLNL